MNRDTNEPEDGPVMDLDTETQDSGEVLEADTQEIVTDAEAEAVEPSEEAIEAGAEGEGEEDAKPDLPLGGVVEAILFSSDVPLNQRALAKLARNSAGSVLKAIDDLNVFYVETGRAFRIAALAEGFQMVTAPEFAEPLTHLHKEKMPTRLSKAALETLAIIAFKQPVTRAEVDAIRGVSASDRVLRNLIERKVVKIAGRAEAPGKPLLYATTREFLAYFGLGTLSDLPRPDELVALLAGEITEEARRTVASDVEAELGPEAEEDGSSESDVEAASSTESDPEIEEDSSDALDREPSELLEDLEVLADESDSEEEPELASAAQSHSGEESDTLDESTET